MISRPQSSSLAEMILRAGAQVSHNLSIRLKPLGIQVDEMRVLQALSTEGGLSMRELSEELVINGPTLTKMADRLVSNNLVYRTQDPEDRRRVRLHLTEMGVECARDGAAIAMEYQQHLADQYSPTDFRDLLAALSGSSKAKSG